MVFKIKLILIGLSALGFASCAMTMNRTQSSPDVFQVGEIEVRLYQNRDDMVKDLPPFFTLLEAAKVGNMQVKVCGYFDREKNRIYAIDDARILLHEMKHYLEPDWQHDEQTPPCKVK